VTREPIYLAGETRAARTYDPRAAEALQRAAGYRICTREEYERMRRPGGGRQALTELDYKQCKGCEWLKTRYGVLGCRHPRKPAQPNCPFDTRQQEPALAPCDYPAWRDPKRGRVYAVTCGISSGTVWMTAWITVSGSCPRYVTKYLPLRDTRDEAVADLRRYAQARGWEEVATP
jgi:hypothetical protein